MEQAVGSYGANMRGEGYNVSTGMSIGSHALLLHGRVGIQA